MTRYTIRHNAEHCKENQQKSLDTGTSLVHDASELTRTMKPYTRFEVEVHSAGRELQKSLPSYMGLKIHQLEVATGFSWGTVCTALLGLEEKGLVSSEKTGTGRRKHGSIRFKGQIRIKRSA
jgi:hypothetical protein